MQKHEQWCRRLERPEWESACLPCAYLYASPSIREKVTKRLALPLIDSLDSLPDDAETLVVAGGGTVLDRAKHFRVTERPKLQLFAIPSIWGSGAEVSPIAVLNPEHKEIHCSEHLVPDRYLIWPELAESAPAHLLRFACGDVWAHALEAFWSPIASDTIRAQAAGLMNEIAGYPLGFDPRWFDASAAACLLQARSSVGLIHGFAHVLEPLLRAADPARNWGHARLCSTLLLPVANFNLERSQKLGGLAAKYGLEFDTIRTVANSLFSESDYVTALSVAERQWEAIARDRCSRTNCVLVRRDSLTFFQQFVVSGVRA